MPENPGAWLMKAAKRRAIDSLRRGRMLLQKHEETAVFSGDLLMKMRNLPEAREEIPRHCHDARD
jgi:predicted RNA polymerase sigma factor